MILRNEICSLMMLSFCILTSALFSGCGEKPAAESARVLDTDNVPIEVPVSGGDGTDVSIGTDTDSLDFIFSWKVWWNGNDGIDIPSCGKPLRKECTILPTSEELKENCAQEAQKIHQENFENGFYFERISLDKACRQKCNHKPPKCSGISCVGDYLSYAGKKILQATELCYLGCKEAAARGIVVPVVCKNFKEDPRWKEAAAQYSAKRKELEKDPDLLQARQRLGKASSLLNERQARLEHLTKGAVDKLEDHVQSVFTPRLTSLMSEIRSREGELMVAVDRAQRGTLPVLEEANNALRMAAQNAISEDEAQSRLKALEQLQPVACNGNLVREPAQKLTTSLQERDRLMDDLMVLVRDVENPELTRQMQANLKKMREDLSVYEAPPEFVSGRAQNEACVVYRKALRITQLAVLMTEAARAGSEISAILKKTEEGLKAIENVNKHEEFVARIIKQAAELGQLVRNSARQNEIQKAQAAAAEAYKALYLILIPAIELHPTLQPAAKVGVIDEAERLVMKDISRWQRLQSDFGLPELAASRADALRKRLLVLKEATTRSPMLLEQWRVAASALRNEVRDQFALGFDGVPKSDAEALKWDTELTEIQKSVVFMEGLVRGGAQ